MRKKKFLSLLLTFAMMMCLMPMKIFSAGSVTLSVEPSVAEAHPGDDVDFAFYISPVQELACLHIKYDIPAGLAYKSFTKNISSTDLGTGGQVDHNETRKDIAVTSSDTGCSVSSKTKLFTITCSVKDDAEINSTPKLTVSDPGEGDYCFDLDEEDFNVTVNSTPVTITPAPVEADGISILPSPLTLKKGNSGHITANVTPIGATNSVTWSVDPSSVVTLTDDPTDMTGRNLKKIVTAGAVGTATITATTDNGKTATCTVTVVECTHDHKTHVDAQDATCTEPGHNEYDHCEECGQDIGREDYPALGHDWSTTYEYSDTQHWRVCTRNGSHEDRGDHTFGAATYTWSAGNSTCTASHTCTVCNKEVSETVDAEPSTTPATCTEAEKTTYTATFTKTGFTPQTKEVTVGEALGHNWGAPTYIWSEDNSTCTATRTCKRDASHKLTQTVSTTVKETTATCTNAGTTIYEATFTTAGLEGKAESDPVPTDALGHDYITTIVNEVTDTEDGLMVTKCQRCGDETQKVIPALSKGQAKQLVASVPMNGENIGLVIQDPYEVLPDGTKLIVELAEKDSARWNELSPQLDDKYPIENIAFFDIKLTDLQGNQLPMPLTQKVRVLIQNPNGWDKEDLEAVLVSSGADIDFEESIVTKDGVDYLAFWTDHFSPYAAIDKLTDAEAAELAAISAAEKAEKGKGGLKTGETIEMYVTFSMILFSAAGILLISLKKRKKAE